MSAVLDVMVLVKSLVWGVGVLLFLLLSDDFECLFRDRACLFHGALLYLFIRLLRVTSFNSVMLALPHDMSEWSETGRSSSRRSKFVVYFVPLARATSMAVGYSQCLCCWRCSLSRVVIDAFAFFL